MNIGSNGKKTFTLPAELATETIAVLGRRGSGKTNTATVCVEELLEQGSQVVIVDPIGTWWGLQSSADGKHDGHAILIVGGQHGDMPLAEGDGAVLGRFLVESGASAVLDLSSLASRAAEKRFATDFADALFEAKRGATHRAPLMVVLEEASLFVPQRIQPGEQRMVGAFQRLVRQGRNFGFGCMMIDQRPASVNKDVLTQIELLIVHQLTSPQDREALSAWVEAHDTGNRQKEFMASLAHLARGEAWIWSPAWLDLFVRVQIRSRKTFDSSSTPKVGERLATPERRAAVDLEALKAQLGETIETARADDPKILRARIAELEKELENGSGREEVEVEVPVFGDDDRTMLEALLARANEMVEMAEDLRGMHEGLEGFFQLFGARPAKAVEPKTANPQITVAGRTDISGREIRNGNPVAPRSPKEGGLEKCPRKLLGVLAQFTQGRTFSQLAILSGYSGKSGGFRNAISALRTAGLIEGDRGHLQITAAGVKAAGQVDPLPSGQALVDHWKGQLGKCERELLQILVTVYPAALGKTDLASRAGYTTTSGGFRNALSKLRTLELMTGKNTMKAADVFFEKEGAAMKTCRKCGIEKPIDAFADYKDGVDGKKARCRTCINQAQRFYRAGVRYRPFRPGRPKLVQIPFPELCSSGLEKMAARL